MVTLSQGAGQITTSPKISVYVEKLAQTGVLSDTRVLLNMARRWLQVGQGFG